MDHDATPDFLLLSGSFSTVTLSVSSATDEFTSSEAVPQAFQIRSAAVLLGAYAPSESSVVLTTEAESGNTETAPIYMAMRRKLTTTGAGQATSHGSPVEGSEAAPPGSFMALIVSASQNTVALLGLAPQPGVGPTIVQPGDATAPFVGHAPRVTLAASSAPGEMPGWLVQAAWTVALAAFGLAALRVAPFILLYTRFSRDDVLEHERRARLYEAIRADPGVSFGRLAGLVGLAHGAAQHHLRLLERHGLVRRVREGRTTHYYPAGPRFGSPVALAPARRLLLDHLRGRPGLTLGELADLEGHRPQSVWGHLDRLRRAGLVLAERRGRTLAWRLAA